MSPLASPLSFDSLASSLFVTYYSSTSSSLIKLFLECKPSANTSLSLASFSVFGFSSAVYGLSSLPGVSFSPSGASSSPSGYSSSPYSASSAFIASSWPKQSQIICPLMLLSSLNRLPMYRGAKLWSKLLGWSSNLFTIFALQKFNASCSDVLPIQRTCAAVNSPRIRSFRNSPGQKLS